MAKECAGRPCAHRLQRSRLCAHTVQPALCEYTICSVVCSHCAVQHTACSQAAVQQCSTLVAHTVCPSHILPSTLGLFFCTCCGISSSHCSMCPKMTVKKKTQIFFDYVCVQEDEYKSLLNYPVIKRLKKHKTYCYFHIDSKKFIL